jgi:N-methylhydantoinase A/oxoprolinase/acetone carboxylase beta subunit
VVDVGGTTTDVCLLRDGAPRINREGCTIGRWRTHVEAVDMYTAGAGGDSRITCHRDGRIELEPARVQPLAMTPDLPDPRTWMDAGLDSVLVLPVAGLDREVIDADPVLTALDRLGPLPPSRLGAESGITGILLEKRLEHLAYRQRLVLAGFTPTDALHALGRLDIGAREHSERAAMVFAAAAGLAPETFCRRVVEAAETAIETIILSYLGRTVWQDDQAVPVLNRRDNELFTLRFALKLPLVGIGAAARSFLPGVAERLGTTVTFLDHCEVGNAIGAALIGLDQA